MLPAAIGSFYRRDGAVAATALALLILLAWLAVLAGAGTGMDPFAMSGWLFPSRDPASLSGSWTPAYWLISFFMWTAMMVAMMLPSASPMLLLYALVMRQSERKAEIPDASLRIAAFAAGYLALWSLFSLFAVTTQWGLEHFGAMSAMMMLRSPVAAGALLIAAGLYQLTPLKDRCLTHCRAPASFIAQHWRPGVGGAWSMGLMHGVYCVGCCLALMLLLFVGGVMNLIWIAGLSLIVLAEKLLPHGERLRLALGLLLMVAGLGLIVAAS
jgi:predicted metal-binding membrane protein